MTTRDLPTPATTFPFQPGEAVYVLPSNHRALLPAPRIHAVVVGEPGIMTRVQFDDGRRACVNTTNLAHRGYCKRCSVPALLEHTRRREPVCICPICGKKAVDQPLPDVVVASLFPINGWHTPMIMLRSMLNTGWSFKKALIDTHATIERTYQAMLILLGLAQPRHRPGDLWMVDHRKIELLQFYAMIDFEFGFEQTYHELMIQQMRDSGDGPGHPSRRLNLPPLPIIISIDDCEPDGPDELTRWLEQQFQ